MKRSLKSIDDALETANLFLQLPCFAYFQEVTQLIVFLLQQLRPLRESRAVVTVEMVPGVKDEVAVWICGRRMDKSAGGNVMGSEVEGVGWVDRCRRSLRTSSWLQGHERKK